MNPCVTNRRIHSVMSECDKCQVSTIVWPPSRVKGDILLQHTATHCNTLQHTAQHCNTLPHTVTHCSTLQHTAAQCNTLQHTATHCNTLQHTATRHGMRQIVCNMARESHLGRHCMKVYILLTFFWPASRRIFYEGRHSMRHYIRAVILLRQTF